MMVLFLLVGLCGDDWCCRNGPLQFPASFVSRYESEKFVDAVNSLPAANSQLRLNRFLECAAFSGIFEMPP
jgi:hypothetical protein